MRTYYSKRSSSTLWIHGMPRSINLLNLLTVFARIAGPVSQNNPGATTEVATARMTGHHLKHSWTLHFRGKNGRSKKIGQVKINQKMIHFVPNKYVSGKISALRPGTQTVMIFGTAKKSENYLKQRDFRICGFLHFFCGFLRFFCGFFAGFCGFSP